MPLAALSAIIRDFQWKLIWAGWILATPFVSCAGVIQYPEADLPELAKLLEQARDNAPALVAQAIAKDESSARLNQARASYWPRVDLSGNFGQTNTSYMSGNYPDEQTVGITFNAVITRPLYHWGAIEAAIQQARLDFANEELQRVYILRNLKRGLRADYLNLLVNNASLENLRLRRQITQDNIARTQADKQQGVVSPIANEQSSLALNQDLIAIEQLEAEQQRIVANYKRNIGWDAPLALDKTVPLPDTASLLAWVVETRRNGINSWLHDTSEVQRRQNLIAREHEELIRVKATQRPLLNLSASVGQNQQNTAAANNVQAISFFAGIGMSWNVFDGFSTSAKKRETLLRTRRLERQLEDFKAEMLAQGTNLLTQIGFMTRQLQIDERLAQLARQTFSSQELEFKTGRISPPVFRTIQQEHNEGELVALRSRVKLLLAITDYLDLTLPVVIDTHPS